MGLTDRSRELRDPHNDRSCEKEIDALSAGYCDCGDGLETRCNDCLSRETFTCADVCSSHGGDAPSTFCLGWYNSLKACSTGAIERWPSRTCTAEIGKHDAGYCDCGRNVRTAIFHCGHRPFTCAQLCAGASGQEQLHGGASRSPPKLRAPMPGPAARWVRLGHQGSLALAATVILIVAIVGVVLTQWMAVTPAAGPDREVHSKSWSWRVRQKLAKSPQTVGGARQPSQPQLL